MKTATRSPFILVAAVLFLVSYSFLGAAWTAPGSTPPSGNTDAPINVGSTTQTKTGNFMANIMAAATSTWSPEYCDELGNNCIRLNGEEEFGSNPYIEIDFIAADGRQSPVLANSLCIQAGFDGLWAYEDRSGNDEIFCYRSNIVTTANVQRFVTGYHALRLDPAFQSYWGAAMPTNAGRCNTNTLYRCNYGWYALGDFSNLTDTQGVRRQQTYDKICAFMMVNGKWKTGTEVEVFDGGSDNSNNSVYWNGTSQSVQNHNNNNRDDVLELTCIGDQVSAQGAWWLKSNRVESYNRSGNKYPVPPMR